MAVENENGESAAHAAHSGADDGGRATKERSTSADPGRYSL